MDMKLFKDRVKGQVSFSFFRDGNLWYSCDDGWQFPVSVDETKDGQGGFPTFNRDDKAIYFMRWIRKAMESEDSDK